MLKDDRMMSLLTFVVVLLAIGTFAQRSELISRLLGRTPAVELHDDTAMTRHDQVARIDVLANDVGVGPEDRSRLVIVTPPDCGRALVREGIVEYVPRRQCAGRQSFRYSLLDLAQEVGATVTVTVRMAEPAEVQPPAAEGGDGAETADAAAPAAEATASVGTPPRVAGELAGAALSPPPVAPQPPGAPATSDAAGGTGAPRPDVAGPEPMVPDSLQTAAPLADAEPPLDDLAAGAPRGVAAPEAPKAPEAPGPSEACALPPAITLDVGPAAETTVIVEAPCAADTVARLSYDGLTFGLPLDARGEGSLRVPGFQAASDAELRFADGGRLAFNIPFADVERVIRVAVAWDAPAELGVEASPPGALPGAAARVSPTRRSSFAEVQRSGGGYLVRYDPVGGIGSHIEVFTYWRRYDTGPGVIRLALVPPGGEGCGLAGAGLDYRVIRSVAGRLERPLLGRLSALSCQRLAAGGAGAIDEAIEDLVIR